MHIGEGERVPMITKLIPGKFFAYKDINGFLYVLLTFPNSNESLLERFLYKTENVIKRQLALIPDEPSFLKSIDMKIRVYGVHHLKDKTPLQNISKINFTNSVFQEKAVIPVDYIKLEISYYYLNINH